MLNLPVNISFPCKTVQSLTINVNSCVVLPEFTGRFTWLFNSGSDPHAVFGLITVLPCTLIPKTFFFFFITYYYYNTAWLSWLLITARNKGMEETIKVYYLIIKYPIWCKCNLQCHLQILILLSKWKAQNICRKQKCALRYRTSFWPFISVTFWCYHEAFPLENIGNTS